MLYMWHTKFNKIQSYDDAKQMWECYCLKIACSRFVVFYEAYLESKNYFNSFLNSPHILRKQACEDHQIFRIHRYPTEFTETLSNKHFKSRRKRKCSVDSFPLEQNQPVSFSDKLKVLSH